ncbi:uncharacterized protein [Choristoneura fumiferana]|uniref:uncharacterized protein n=1 Tax=Choristoneura fumiferana TaxID=7141 RepID=UPI003D1547FE
MSSAAQRPLKVYTSMYDIFGPDPYNNPFYVETKKSDNVSELPLCGRKALSTKSRSSKSESPRKPPEKLITSEMLNSLMKYSSKSSVLHSSSTSFYDLDSVVKKHSFRCLSEICVSNANILKSLNVNVSPKNGFDGKSDCIVQDCATDVRPAFIRRVSKEIDHKSNRKNMTPDCLLSCDMCLREDDCDVVHHQKSTICYDVNDPNGKGSKFWSYSKYRSENSSVSKKKKDKRRKDKKVDKCSKHAGNPCPCHLFSYGCPCKDKSSLTELPKSSKSLTVAEQNTSTPNIMETICGNVFATKRHSMHMEDKLTGLSGDGLVEKHDKEVSQNDSAFKVTDTKDVTQIDTTPCESKQSKKTKRSKKMRLIKCPKCKEKVEINLEMSTEDEDSLKCQSTIYSPQESPKTSVLAPAHSVISDIQEMENETNACNHEPKCDMVHICQIVPTENIECLKKQCNQPRSTPRIIKITKACRHHPPCTVVPSCQRANVLKNNCEYVPPCLHHPRCVNLPLCVPFTKSLHYDETTNNYVDLEENTDGFHVPRYKYMSLCQHDSLENTAIPHMQHAFELRRTQQQQPYFQNQTCMSNTFSPYQIPHPCNCCKSNKSCQHGEQDTANCKCFENEVRERPSNAVVFIRDVGCQFRDKTYALDDSVLQPRLRYTCSSNSFHLPMMRMGNYYTKVHTVRCEDKYTTPKSGEDYSRISIDSITSMEIDANCPSHGFQATQKAWPFGFDPESNKSTYVAAYMTHADPTRPPQEAEKASEKSSNKFSSRYSDDGNVLPVKPGRYKGKCRKTFCVKQRRKSKTNHLANCCSRKTVYQMHAVF